MLSVSGLKGKIFACAYDVTQKGIENTLHSCWVNQEPMQMIPLVPTLFPGLPPFLKQGNPANLFLSSQSQVNMYFLLLSVGARVFARWTNGFYYRGFVLSATSTTVSVRYDDGDKTTLEKNDPEAVVLDTLSCQSDITVGQRAIGFWSMLKAYRFYPGKVTEKKTDGQDCLEASYHIKFDDGDNRWESGFEIRIFPWMGDDYQRVFEWRQNVFQWL